MNNSFSEIYFEESFISSISYEDNKVEDIISGKGSGFGIRFVKSDETYFGSTSDATETGLKALINKLKIEKEIAFPEFKPQYLAFTSDPHTNGSSVGARGVNKEEKIEDKIKYLEFANKIARAFSGYIVQVSAGYSFRLKKIAIANSDGMLKKVVLPLVVFSVNVVASDKGKIQTAREPVGGSVYPEELLNFEVVEKITKKASKRAVELLTVAKDAPTGEMMIVISSEAGGTMIHEAIGHSIEADLVQKGISPVYKGKIGQIVASEIITVIDDPTIPKMLGYYPFDDEGTPSQKTVLVEKGFLKNYLHSLQTAKKDNSEPTGNGRRESYGSKPYPRMSKTYIAPGETEPEKIIQSVSNGLFVRKMGGGQVNTATGDFVFEVEEGYEIIDGSVGQMIKGASLVGNGPEVLKTIDMVGSDLGWAFGWCGKEGQSVPVSDGQPTIRIPKIVVGGSLI